VRLNASNPGALKEPYQLSRRPVRSRCRLSRRSPLLGLSEEQATLRLKAEPALSWHRCQVDPTAAQEDRCRGDSSRLATICSTAHPPTFCRPLPCGRCRSDYTVGPGDQLDVPAVWHAHRNLKLIVARDGPREFSGNSGRFHVGGQSFNAVKSRHRSTRAKTDARRARQCPMGDTAFHTGIRVGRG